MFVKNALYLIVRSFRKLKNVFLDCLATQYYRLVCAEFGKKSKVGWGTWIAQPESVYIKAGVTIGRRVQMTTELPSSKIEIERGVQINEGAKIDFSGSIRIGEFGLISEGVVIYSHSHGHDPRSKPLVFPKIIEECVWIGMNSVVLHNCVRIGKGSLIGAAAVVTRSVEDNVIIVGPAVREIKKLVGNDSLDA